MGYRTKADKVFKLKLIMIFILIIASSISILRFLGNRLIKDTKGNDIYIAMMNYSVPILKQSNNGGEMENSIHIKEYVLDAIGINIYNPITIVSKEIPMISGLDFNKDTPTPIAKVKGITPFNLDENSVVKKEEGDKEKVDTNNPSLKKVLNPSQPEVLIYHSHTTESYAPGSPYSKDNNINIVSVGNVITDELQNNYGISTIHDTTIHNEMYTLSYKKSRVTVQSYLNKFNTFKVIIDLHRDSVPNKAAMTATVGGQSVARLMFVISKARPNFSKNEPLVNNLISNIDRLYPGVMVDRKIYWYNHGSYHFNQDLSDKCVLIEVGSEVNTSEEAQNSGKIIARAIAEELNGKK